MRLAVGTGEVLAAVRESLNGGLVTAPLSPAEPARSQTLAMLRPDSPVTELATGGGVIVATSGSTGRPRGVALPTSALIASATATHQRLAGPGRWVLPLPVHYVAGLMVVVRSLIADRPLLEVDPGLTGLPDLVATRLTGAQRDPAYLSLVPTQLHRALNDPRLTRALQRFSAVLVGGAAAEQQLLERALDAGVRVVTTYGMSETCGGCVYDRVPLDGVEVGIGAHGRLSITGPVLFAGYRMDPVATANSLVSGQLLTGDRGRMDAAGRLQVLGRVDDVVISGGLNVDLAQVERSVLEWLRGSGAMGRVPPVAAVTLGVPDPEWGTEVVAVIEAAPADSQLTLTVLREALGRDLPAYALPRRLVHKTSLPKLESGKIDRQRLIAELTKDSR